MSFSNVSLGYIKQRQPEKAVDLFHQIEKPDDVIRILLFQACAQLKWARALSLTKHLSTDIFKSSTINPRLMTSLLDAFMKCGDLVSAQNLFNQIQSKSLEMYGAMMKGKHKLDHLRVYFIQSFDRIHQEQSGDKSHRSLLSDSTT